MPKTCIDFETTRDYGLYADSLEALIEEFSLAHSRDDCGSDWARRVKTALDERLLTGLERRLPADERRAISAFFTGSQLADRIVSNHLAVDDGARLIADPACGTGDLLVAAAKRLALMPSLDETLSAWGTRLYGTDTRPEFVRVTRARVLLTAMLRQGAGFKGRALDIATALPGLRTGDGLAQKESSLPYDLVLLNPPYHKSQESVHSQWGTGRLSLAALFVDRYVTHAHHGSVVAAILPDVLRTGSLYKRWRRHIEAHCTVTSVEAVGRFHPQVDVDVFILRVTKESVPLPSPVHWWLAAAATGATVESRFVVRVGPVVPYRHPELGPAVPYVHSRNLPRWGFADTSAVGRRHFPGSLIDPPFVAIRRTSAPGDRHRAVGTIVHGDEPVAVENHLVACVPRSGSLDDCKLLMKILSDPRTSQWINDRIRCRHLPVGAVSQIPWWETGNGR